MKKTVIFIILLLFVFHTKVSAQTFNPEQYKTFYNFKTVKQPDNTRLLKVSFSYQNLENKQDEMPVYGAEIQFVNVLNDQENVLGTVKTDKSGIAQITLPENQSYLKNDESYITIIARFEGSDSVESQEEEILFKDLVLELNAEEIDSIKTITVNANYIDKNGELVPVEELEVGIGVGSMIKNLIVDTGTVEAGTLEYEFDRSLPGDKDGNLNLFALLEDNEEFGNVIQMKKAMFGTKFVTKVTENNTLWSSAAPIWMYVVLSILLVGIWSNFTYTIVNLYKIKKETKSKN